MTWQEFVDSHLFAYGVLPLLILLARVMDVTLGTLRIIFVARGLKVLAPILGFFEVVIWLLAIGQVMQNLTNVIHYLAYGLGFALGNYVGIRIEEKLAMGLIIVRVITRRDAGELIAYLRGADYGVTVVDAEGSSGPVHILFMLLKRSDLAKVVEAINRYNPRAFYSVEDVRQVREGIFPTRHFRSVHLLPSIFRVRKGK